jgi:hypothetical protein
MFRLAMSHLQTITVIINEILARNKMEYSRLKVIYTC